MNDVLGNQVVKKLMVVLSLCLVGMTNCGAASQKLTVSVEADVVAEPCSLRSGDELLSLDFGTISNRDLFDAQRTKSIAFQLHLDGCKPALFKTVKVTFTGAAENELPQYLAVSPTSQAKGIAIGLEEENQAFLPINQASQLKTLLAGDNILNFGAFIQILPSAQASGQLITGAFNAQATFKIEYE